MKKTNPITPPKAYAMWLATNRNVLVFDKCGNQIPKYQRAITCYHLNKKLALQATEEAEQFLVFHMNRWAHEINRQEMQYLLGLRTRIMDKKEATRPGWPGIPSGSGLRGP